MNYENSLDRTKWKPDIVEIGVATRLSKGEQEKLGMATDFLDKDEVLFWGTKRMEHKRRKENDQCSDSQPK